jgi:very-short-patch-repair endonuclease
VRVGRSKLKRAKQLRREMTPPEVMLWAWLKVRREGWPSFRRQHPVGPYVLDFYCSQVRLGVEVDGLAHGLGDRPVRDKARDQWLAGQGIEVMRVAASDVMRDAEGVAGWVWARVEGKIQRGGGFNPPPQSGEDVR